MMDVVRKAIIAHQKFLWLYRVQLCEENDLIPINKDCGYQGRT